MSTIAYLILLCICIALAMLVWIMYLQIRELTRRLKNDEYHIGETIQGMGTRIGAIDRTVSEASRRIETLSAEYAVLNNKSVRISTGLDLMKKQIKDLGGTHENI